MSVTVGTNSARGFAAGLQKDLLAVLAALKTGWSNGQVEGQINRLRTLKRQIYGRGWLRSTSGFSSCDLP